MKRIQDPFGDLAWELWRTDPLETDPLDRDRREPVVDGRWASLGKRSVVNRSVERAALDPQWPTIQSLIKYIGNGK